MISLEAQGFYCSIIGEGANVHLDVDALLPRDVAFAVAELIVNAKMEATSCLSSR